MEDSFHDVPPFPNSIPTAPLVRLSLANLRNSHVESERFYSACKGLGFFYLDLRHDEAGEKLLGEADKLFEVGKALFELGREELGKYDYKHLGSYFGYKGFRKAVVDENGTLDWNEFYNVSILSNFD
jgi:isopenicillin N synthase-like dioxygenase